MSIIIFGASGFIGGKLYNYLSENGKKVIGTYNNSPRDGLLHFNLESSDLEKLEVNLEEIQYGIICSAITNMDYCKTNETETYKNNVLGTIRLIKQLFHNNITPIFFSTDYVFDGDKGNYDETDDRSPVLKYGEQKKEVEDFLMQSNKKFIIARIAKVYGLKLNDGTLLTTLYDELINGKTLRYTTDQFISPTYVGDLVMAIELLIKKKLYGCYNVVSPESFSRFKIAQLVKSKLRISTGEVVPCLLKDLTFPDKRPKNTCLNSNKFIEATGFKFTLLESSLDALRYVLNDTL
jgi:dTDP-4-dehydrorhamnose reductase